MTAIISTNIISPLGLTTQETYQAVCDGKSRLASHRKKGLPFEFEASLLNEEQWKKIRKDGLTRFESAVLYSVNDALSQVDIDKSDTIFILSSTKGDVETFEKNKEVSPLGVIARKISRTVGITNEPVVVCNACISGVSAIILAQRLLDCGYYRYAVVCGADIQSRFIVSGFHGFKALSPEPCRPFDIERIGLNLGEAAATVVLRNADAEVNAGCWCIERGAVRNDAYHISAPHPKGDGAYLALKAVTEDMDINDLAVLGVHGTATMYNDQMESKAIERAGLLDIPLSALKGYFGHTMGAAGILETILMAVALDNGIILPTKGFAVRGVSGKVTLSDDIIETQKRSFIKMLSGFGGCNGTVLLTKAKKKAKTSVPDALHVSHTISIRTNDIAIDGEQLATTSTGMDMLTEIYKTRIGGYPRFYKMDMLSRLAFIAVELLVKSERGGVNHGDSRAVVLFNRTSSIIADRQYEKSICNEEEFYPSPATFVYTLPNISTGEIAIRNGYHGETSFYLLPERNERQMEEILTTTFTDTKIKSIIGGWIDCPAEDDFECEIKLYQQ